MGLLVLGYPEGKLVRAKINGKGKTNHWSEGRYTRALYFKNVVIGRDGEVVAAELEGQVGEGSTLVTFNGVLAVVSFLRTHLLVKKLSKSGWENNERSSGVKYDTSAVKLSSGVTEADRIKIDLPVGLSS